MTLGTVFVDAINAHDTWYLLIVPMVVFVALGYKAVRCQNMSNYWREVAVFMIQVLGGMALLTLAFMVVLNILVPVLAPMPG